MANDTLETVNVEAPEQGARRPPYGSPLSPLQTGLLYGGAASTVLGPAGLLIGLGYGLVSKRLKDNWLDKESRYVQNVRAEHDELRDQIDAEYKQADPDEKRLLDHSRRLLTDGYQRIMAGDDAAGSKMIEQANAIGLGVINADSSARKADEASAMGVQRTLIQGAAEGYRREYQQTLGDHDTIQQRTARVFDLLSKSDFDPNKPLNKAIVGDLITEGMGMYRDTPDAWDAISKGAGAFSGIAAAAVDGLAGIMKSQDFKISREDVYRIALNLRQFSDQQAQSRLGQLGKQASSLDQYAKHTRTIAPEYSLGEYISGGVDKLELLPIPNVAPTRSVIQQAQDAVRAPTPTQQLRTRPNLRPVNGGPYRP